jgi:protein-disulfide isomerase
MEETFIEPFDVVSGPRGVARWLPFVIVVLVGLATVGSGIELYRTHQAQTLTLSKDAGENGEAHVRGPATALVSLEEYGDFQCPPCGMLATPLKLIEEQYSPNLRVVFHNFPLPTHNHGHEAAQAAEAAGLQGKFWEMHDLLYHEQPNWAKAEDARSLFSAYAERIGLDVDRFNKDVDSPEVKERVEKDQKQGTSLGVTNTPTLFLNGRSVAPNDLHPGNLEKLIKDMIEDLEKSHSK